MLGGLVCVLGAAALIVSLLCEPKAAWLKRLLLGVSVLTVAAGLLLGGLSLSKKGADTPAPTPVPTPTEHIPSPTPTPAPTAAPTATGRPTSTVTPVPTATSAPKATPLPTATPVLTPTEMPMLTAAPSTAPPSTTDTVTEATVVYVSGSGIMHLKSNCSGMKNYREMTYGSALTEGFARRCKNCFRTGE